MKKFIIAVVIIIIVGVGAYFVVKSFSGKNVVTNDQNTVNNPAQSTSTSETAAKTPVYKQTGATPNLADMSVFATSIGKSVQGKDILAYTYGNGDTNILFVGGIHGGYEWNTVLVAYDLMGYLATNPSAIPANIKVTVIPTLNPDGLAKVVNTDSGYFTQADIPTPISNTISGRFNANNVDLNRNFDCDWQANGVWQKKTVSGGTSAFSEPESQAVENYINSNKPAAVVVYYSSAGGVFSSSCHNGVSSETNTLTQTYANASGYPAHESFDFYATTGDMVNWLAKMNIPAISVLLTNHIDTEWAKNQAGVQAILKYYSK